MALLAGLCLWAGGCWAAEPENDRQVWAEMCYQIARPVLENMSKGELQKNMQMEFSPTWDGRDKRVAYMETFGRLMAGITPWLALPEDNTEEGQMRKQLHEWALLSYKNAVDPEVGRCGVSGREFPPCAGSYVGEARPGDAGTLRGLLQGIAYDSPGL